MGNTGKNGLVAHQIVCCRQVAQFSMKKHSIWFRQFFLLFTIGMLSSGMAAYWTLSHSTASLKNETLAHLVSISPSIMSSSQLKLAGPMGVTFLGTEIRSAEQEKHTRPRL